MQLVLGPAAGGIKHVQRQIQGFDIHSVAWDADPERLLPLGEHSGCVASLAGDTRSEGPSSKPGGLTGLVIGKAQNGLASFDEEATSAPAQGSLHSVYNGHVAQSLVTWSI